MSIVKVEVGPDEEVIVRKKKSTGLAVCVVLDRSASMAPLTPTTIQGFNEFLASVEAEERTSGIPARISLIQFADIVSETHWNVPLTELPRLNSSNYVANGRSTSLYDAIGYGIERLTKAQLPDKTVFVVYTDGQENSSESFTRDQILDLMRRYENQGWQFVFLGVNIDAYAVGGSINFAAGRTVSGSSETARGIWEVTGQSVGRYHRGQDVAVEYSVAEKRVVEREAGRR